METKTYCIKIVHDVDTGGYEATFSQFPTIIIEGKSVDEMLMNAKVELTKYLARRKRPEPIKYEGEEYYPVTVHLKERKRSLDTAMSKLP